ncbi:cytochrome c biogenesis protein ResB [Aquabacterium sp. J223]|uniref:cytochrome c biogenesis protein ResB n=1 Tax=Aquabacterium sp. J223 TaxID=2898431 RepID=UPI0021AE0088|nr:cytochrome c biogenesis protein ResB [Aquabacterium sp. J223]
MPKLFASQVVIHDRETGERKAATVKVNEPAFHRGIAIYQSSFDDGGSSVTLRALPLNGAGAPFEVKGTVGGSTEPEGGRRPDADARIQRPACHQRGEPRRQRRRRPGLDRRAPGRLWPARWAITSARAPSRTSRRRCATSARR